MTTVVGLDVATVTGWARVQGARTTTGVIDASPRGKDEPEGVRYRRLAERIGPVVSDADAVILEQPFTGRRRTATVLGGLIAVVLVHLEGQGTPYAFVSASTLKAFGRRRGAKGKDAMQSHAIRVLGRELTDDEADAWWLTEYWAERMAPEGARGAA